MGRIHLWSSLVNLGREHAKHFPRYTGEFTPHTCHNSCCRTVSQDRLLGILASASPGLPSSTSGGTAPWPALSEGCAGNPGWQHSLGSEFSMCLHFWGENCRESGFQQELRVWNYM